ncbi:TetR/AcrR family transcriptional regulator [Deinococcus sp.]|uniref:TetR/AcrR family transcriptional regulator n=1 Tax=Deinococcus sp. TaxID=47478 RepID=UPI003B5AE8CA
MARPRTISDEQIIGAARETFLEHGFSATTAEIARRAGVSEGTLFKRFASKEELFARTVGLEGGREWHKEITAQVGQGDICDNLKRLAWLTVKMARQVMPHLMLMWSRGQLPPISSPGWEDPTKEDRDALASYLGAEVALGRLRPIDCEVVAEALLGALTSHVHRELMLGQGLSSERFVRGLVESWWPGLKPLDSPTAAAEPPSSKSELPHRD